MHFGSNIVSALVIAAGLAGTSAVGQEHAMATDLPAICLEAGQAGEMSAHGGGMEMGTDMDMGGDEAHRDLMDGMDAMNVAMMAGGSAPDIDVAFVCAMIPHHRGAIDMAKAELVHGDEPWAREMAQKLIDAQEKEIADMLAWLNERGR